MGGESTICWNLAAPDVLSAQLDCTRKASSWYFSILRRRCMALGLQRWHVGSDVHHPGATLIYLTVPRDFYGHIDGSSITRQR